MDKNNKIAQLDIMNTRLHSQNNCQTELCSRGKLYEEEKTGNEEEDSGVKDEIEDHSEQTKRQTTTKKTKCKYYENTKCIKENCTYRYPRRVCKNYNLNKCDLGRQCKDNHPGKDCPH